METYAGPISATGMAIPHGPCHGEMTSPLFQSNLPVLFVFALPRAPRMELRALEGHANAHRKDGGVLLFFRHLPLFREGKALHPRFPQVRGVPARRGPMFPSARLYVCPPRFILLSVGK